MLLKKFLVLFTAVFGSVEEAIVKLWTANDKIKNWINKYKIISAWVELHSY